MKQSLVRYRGKIWTVQDGLIALACMIDGGFEVKERRKGYADGFLVRPKNGINRSLSQHQENLK